MNGELLARLFPFPRYTSATNNYDADSASATVAGWLRANK